MDVHVVAINGAVMRAPCHTAFSADHTVIQEGRATARAFKSLVAGGYEVILAMETQDRLPGAIHVERRLHSGLSDDPKIIRIGGTSGSGAVNLAYLKRAQQVFLLGYDYDRLGAHFISYDPPDDPAYCLQIQWAMWAAHYDSMLPQLKASGVEVINCNPDSVISAFPKMTWAEAVDEYL